MLKSAAEGQRRSQAEKFAEELGEILANKVFGELGPTLDTSLADIEEAVRPVLRAVVRGMVAKAVNQQGERLEQEQACPDCGQPCELERAEKPREIATSEGAFSFRELRGFCPRCERAFFPSADRAAD